MNMLVIDAHTHVGRWNSYGVADDPGEFVRNMDAAGIDRACVNCILYPEARRANDLVARYVARHPDRLYPVAYVSPRYPDEAMLELRRAFDDLRMRFLFIPEQQFGQLPMDDTVALSNESSEIDETA